MLTTGIILLVALVLALVIVVPNIIIATGKVRDEKQSDQRGRAVRVDYHIDYPGDGFIADSDTADPSEEAEC